MGWDRAEYQWTGLAQHYHLTSTEKKSGSGRWQELSFVTHLGFGSRAVHLEKARIMDHHFSKAGGKIFLPYFPTKDWFNSDN